ncbi:MAG: CRISPR-associated protein Cas4 [Zoogloeaceae bacterium]|nr:CRISPR-associated protein Cas4 [Rhodocyclaceae bacterium]MCP5234312.1 CRISPR-associated protein Cas4 [Zoogloeaceae bacterium]
MDDELIPLSALQHYLYCPRQCALIHVERLWAENRQTAEGRILHDRADQPQVEHRHGVRTVTAMPLAAPELGIAGIADVVEFHVDGSGETPYPVEYKRGRPKAHHADRVQLCAQGLCLEAMFGRAVPEGALFYGTTRRRLVVPLNEEMRDLTRETIRATRAMLATGRTPLATYDAKRCDACSLLDLCQPRLLARSGTIQSWLEQQIFDED